VNLFLVGWAPGSSLPPALPGRVIASFLADVPFLPGAPVETWAAPSGRAVAAWASHDAEQVGGVRYVHAAERGLALFAGRPVAWSGDGRADGRGPLDPRHYLAPAATWARTLDGRVTAVRCDDDASVLEVFSDPLGAYPVYRADHLGAVWISNVPEVLRRITGSTAVDPGVVASVLGGGWSLSGDPMWAAVRRVPRGVVLGLRPDGERVDELLPLEDITPLYGAGAFDAAAAARAAVENLRALADWPGRPSLVRVTGGRDSRIILAAALHAGFPVRGVTGGAPDDPDMVIGRELCERVGVPHAALPPDPHGNVFFDPAAGARLAALTASGTATAADGGGFPHGPVSGPLPLSHTGQGGEIARRYFGDATTPDALYRAFVLRRPWREELLAPGGRALVRAAVEDWAGEQRAAGVRPADLPDAFYLLRRMGTWAGAGQSPVEWVSDATSALWSTRMLAHELALPAADRRREAFHLRLCEELAPALVPAPFADGEPWAALEGQLAARRRRARRTGGKVLALGARRAAPVARRARAAAIARVERVTGRGRDAPGPGTPPSSPPPRDPNAELAASLARRLRAGAAEPILAVLDRDRTLALLDRPPASHDVVERFQVLRLATLMAAHEAATARPGL
jgi:hypothetical protein